MKAEYICSSTDEMKPIAQTIAERLKTGDIILLSGDLGTGKTTIAAMIIQAVCGSDVEVTSPTFNIMQSYHTTRGEIWHYDLYRIEQAEELEEIGLSEALQQAITIIEWPDIAMPFIKNHRHISLRLDYAENGNGRILKYSEEA